MNEIVKLSLDLYKGQVTNYSAKESNEVLRKALVELAGGNETITYKQFRKVKPEFFEILEEMITPIVVEGLENQFSDFAEIRNLAWGETNVFHVENSALFKVATIADGTGNLRRQRIDNGEFTVDTKTKGVKIYEELYRFLAGRIDWVSLVNKVAKSYQLQIANDVYDALYGSFSKLNSTYGVSSAYDETKLVELAQHVEAGTGANVIILGTKAALSKVAPSVVGDASKDARNKMGFYGEFNGFELREIKQAHKAGTDTFAIDNNFLLVVPTLDNKLVKIVNEGDALIEEGQATADKSKEYEFLMKSGVAVVSSTKYGIYKLG
jgi:hypothetical protein